MSRYRCTPFLPLLVLVAACGTSQRPDPRLPEPYVRPATFGAGEPRPYGVRIENRSADSVVVFLDGYTGHVRVGDVAGGETRTFPLQGQLVTYPAGLRFHAFGWGDQDHTAITIPMGGGPILDLPIPAERPRPCRIELYVDGVRTAGTLAIDPDLIESVAYREPEDLKPQAGSQCPSLHVTTRSGS